MNPYHAGYAHPWHTGYDQHQQAAYASAQQPLVAPLPPPILRQPVQGPVRQPAVAYTSVAAPVRQAQPQQQPSRADAESQSSWPPALRKYVERAFALDVNGEERLRLQQNLKEIISTAQQRGEVWTRDWDRTPLPDVLPPPRVERMEAPAPAAPLVEQRNGALLPRPAIQSPRQRKRLRSPEPSPVSASKAKQGAAKPWKGTKQVPRNKFEAVYEVNPDREEARARRFGNGLAIGAVKDKRGMMGYGSSWSELGSTVESESGDLHGQAVKGTCREVEKSYFRLTSKPDPSTVRPEPVLLKALRRLVLLLRQKKVTYFYAADQFKGMRQDCTVQHLRNSLSASIYEAHARAALEHGDMAEFNQCQSQLQQHYSMGIYGCREEFTAYRLLYQALHGRENHAALLSCLQSLSPEDAQHPSVSHALQVRQSLAAGDLAKVCVLYSRTPNMGRALLDTVLPRIRFAALKVLVKAYLPSLPVHAVARRLGFSGADANQEAAPSLPEAAGHLLPLPGCTEASFTGRYSPKARSRCPSAFMELSRRELAHMPDLYQSFQQESSARGDRSCEAWLQEQGACLVASPGGKAVDCKASSKDLHFREDTAPVAAGPDLDINDFLAKSLAGYDD